MSSLDSSLPTYSRADVSRPSWEGFVRNGSRVKNILQDTLQVVQTQWETEKKKRRLGDLPVESNQPARQIQQSDHYTADLVREKSTQLGLLQRKMQDFQARIDTLEATNASLREEVSSSNATLEQTRQALRVAGSNAQKARENADACQVTAASLSNTLESLQSVVHETKAASQVLQQEHLKIQDASAALQTKMVQKEADFVRMQQSLRNLHREHNRLLEAEREQAKEKLDLQDKIELKNGKLQEMERTIADHNSIDEERKKRVQHIEEEHRRMQVLLAEACQSNDELETPKLLQETIFQLEATNLDLHERLKELQNASRKETSLLNEALTKAEKQIQNLKIQLDDMDDVQGRLRTEKSTAEKLISSLKCRISALERPQTFVSPQNPETPKVTGLAVKLPSLSKDACCVCTKPAIGLMKTCQCSNKLCDKRAHVTCIQHTHSGLSASHPSTPAALLPVVLCSQPSLVSASK